MNDIVFIRLLFVAGMLGLAGVAVLLGYVMTWLQGRQSTRRDVTAFPAIARRTR